MSTSGARARHSTVFQRWSQQDEVPAPRALDDSFWQPNQWPAKAAVLSLAMVPLLLWADGDYRPPAQSVPDDQSTWQAPITNLPAARLGAFWHQDEIPAAAVPASLGEGFQSYGQRARNETRFVQWSASEELPVATVFRPVEEDAPDFTGLPPSYQVVVWAGDEEVVPVPPLTADAEGWQAPVVLLAKPAQPDWTDSEFVPRPALLDDETWQPPAVLVRPSLPAPWVDVDIVPSAAPSPVFDDDTTWQPLALRLGAAPSSLWADDDIVPQAIVVLDDSTWDAPVVVSPKPFSVVWMQQDERIAPLLVDIDFLCLELRSYQPAPDLRVFQDDGNFTPAPTYVYTHDSRKRVGHRKGRAKNGRIGPSNEGSGSGGIGET